MASNTVNLIIKLTPEGFALAVKESAQLNANLNGAAAAAVKVGSASKALAAAKSSSATTQENIEYGKQRSIGGIGSGTRDFAQQAQGLGGVVHLYATFAANLYAANAAFRALSDAVNTAHLVQGLDQLGAASGKALGTLAVRLNNATDGALSLKAALASVATASAIGMTNAQILMMGEVAKKASQALGRDMPDALDRLTRGIGKNQPELLDELGILVNANTVYKNYALSIGKSTSALSDFEKKQAFANAVLKQGMDKFSAIDIPTNPFVKIEASMSNLLQSGLSLINKVISPLVNLLSESPAALAAVLAGIGTILVKQAIPAIGAFRENIKAAAAEAGQLANIRSATAYDASGAAYREAGLAKLKAARDAAHAAADAEIAIMDAAEKKMADSKVALAGTTSRRVRAILKTDPTRVTEDDLSSLDRIANKLQKSNAEGASAIREYGEAVVHYNIAESHSASIKAELLDKTKELNDEIGKGIKVSGIGMQQQMIADRANRAAAFANVSNIVAQTTQTEGFFAAVKKGWAEVGKVQAGRSTLPVLDASGADTGATRAVKGIDELGGRATRALGAVQSVGKNIGVVFTAATGAITTALNAFAPWMQLIGLVLAGVAAFNAWMTDNAKQVQEFGAAVTTAAAAAKLAVDTLAAIDKQGFSKGLDAVNIQSRANAFLELSDSVGSLQEKFAAIGAASSGWDKFWDKVSSGLPILQSHLQKLSGSLSTDITSSISLIDDKEAREALRTKLGNILGTSNFSKDSLKKIFDKAGNEGGNALAASIAKTLGDSAQEINISASKLTSSNEGFGVVNKALLVLNNSLKDSSPITAYADSMLTQSTLITEAFEDPYTALSRLNELVKDGSKRQLFSEDSQKMLLQEANKIKLLVSQVNEYNAAVKAGEVAKEAQAGMQAKISSLPLTSQRGSGPVSSTPQDNPEFLKLQKIIDEGTSAEGLRINIKAKLVGLQDQFKGILIDPFKTGIKYLTEPLNDALAKAGLGILATISSGFSGVGSADLQTDIKNKELDVQERTITAMYDLVNSLEINSKSMELAQAERDASVAGTDVQRGKYLDIIEELRSQLKFLNKGFRAGLADFNNDLSKTSKVAMQGNLERNIGVQTKVAGIDANKVSNTIQGDRAERVLEEASVSRVKQARLDIQNINAANAKLVYTSGSIEDDTAYTAQQSAQLTLQNSKDELASRAAIFKVEQERTALALLLSRAHTSEQEANAKKSVATAEQDKTNLLATQSAQAVAAATTSIIDGLNRQLAIKQLIAAFDEQMLQLGKDYQVASLTADKTELANLTTIGATTEEYSTKRLAALDSEIEKKNQSAQISAVEADAASARAVLQTQLAAKTTAIDTGTGSEVQKAEAKAAAISTAALGEGRVNAILAAKEAIINRNSDATQRGIELIKEQTLETAKLNSITAGLEGIFGKVGTAIGGLVSSFEKVTEANKAAADEAQRLNDTYKNDPSIDNKKAAAAATENATKVALQGDAKILSSAKNMFGQKTTAYKVLGAAEKAVHVASLAMDAAKMISTLATIGPKIASGVAELFAQGGWVGFAGAAAFLALMAGLGFASSGKSSAPPKGFSSEDRQVVQGTGQSYNAQGKMIETGGGVLGDPNAKMNSVVNALESIKSTSVDQLSFSNKMVDLLSSINDGINKGAAILASIPGLRNSSGFGTVEGSSSSKLTGNPKNIISDTLNSIMAPIKDLTLNPIKAIGNFLSSLPGSKSSTSSTIVDSGIKVAGNLADLAKGIGVMQQYENDIITKKSSSLFGLISSTKTSNVTQTKDLGSTEQGKQVQNFFTQVFSSSVSLLEELGTTFGKTKDQVDSILAKIPISAIASLKGLSGTDFTNALAGLVNSVLDTASKALFGNLIATYQKVGESSLETLSRIADDNQKVNLALQSIGKTTTTEMVKTSGLISGFFTWATKLTAEQGIAISEALVEGAGGLSTFLSQASNYSKNFMTDAQRLAPVQKAVNKGLVDLGLTGIDTRDKFAAVVSGLDLTTKSGQDTYQGLMNISDAFAQVYTATQKTLSAEDFRIKVLNNDIALQKALGNQYQALVLTRKEELYQLSLYPKAQSDVLIAQQRQIYALQDTTMLYNQQVAILKAQGKATESLALQRQLELLAMDDRLRPGQVYINALNDEADLVAKIATARDTETAALKATLSGLKGYITTLQTYKTTLAGGSSSILTEQQKYQQAKENLSKLQATATGPASTPEQVAAQAAAVNGLSGAADIFLQSSQTMFASSDQYTTDYNSVMKLLDSTTAVLTGQESDAQRQLDQLTLSTSFLDTIATASQTTASLLTQYYAQQGITAIARNAVPTSNDTSAVVGSSLATIANVAGMTSSPTYEPATNQTANTILTDQLNALTAQISSLQNEVAGLRADQSAQTGDLIAATTVTSGAIVTAVGSNKTIQPVSPTRFGVVTR